MAKFTNDPRIIYEKGMARLKSGDSARAFKRFRQAADRGYAAAMYQLGVMYADGERVPADDDVSFSWTLMAAEKGYREAFGFLADKYYYGKGCRKDLDKSLEWMERARDANKANRGYRDNVAFLRAEMEKERITKEIQPLIDKGMEAYRSGDYKTAVSYFTRAAGKDDPTGLNNLSVCYVNGQGVEVDKVRSFELMKKAADMDYRPACRTLAMKYREGNGVSKDINLAAVWAKKAVELDGENPEYKRTLDEIEQEISKGMDADKCINDGIKAMDDGEEKKGFRLFESAALMGSALGMYDLALCYANGRGIEMDFDMYNKWMEQSAERGYEKARQNRFDTFMFGKEKDMKKALYWAQKLRDIAPDNQLYRENLSSIIRELRTPDKRDAANLVNEGMDHLSKDENDEAFACFRQAARMDFPLAMHNLSVCYAKGWGTPVDRKLAFEWMKRAAEGDYPEACKVLSVKYYQGDGTEKDRDAALKWIKRALELDPDNRTYKEDLQELDDLMNGRDPKPRIPEKPVDPDRLMNQAVDCLQSGDIDKGMLLLNEAARMGSTMAMYNLSLCYLTGEGIDKDERQAFKWMLRSADLGCRDAYMPLVNLFSEGIGTRKDLHNALYWADKAVEAFPGDINVLQRRAQIDSLLRNG